MLDHTAASSTASPAFETLVAACLPQLRRRAARLCHRQGDADDVVQDALVRAFRARDGLRDHAHARGWLLSILGTTFLDRCRRRRVRPLEVEMSFEPPAASHDDAPAWADLSTDDVRAAVDRLPDDVRDTFRMFALEGHDYIRIAAVQRIPKATVGSRIHRARRQLRALLAGS